MTTTIDLREVWREDWKELIALHTADQERTRKMIQRFEADIPDIVPTPLPKYVPEPKKKMTLIELLQAPKLFVQQYLP